jgi:predicted PurR-regulated permease PerM
MAKKKYTPSEKWERKHGQAYSRWMVVKYIILFVLGAAVGILAAMQAAALLQRLGVSQKVAWIAAVCLPLLTVAFVYFGVFFPLSRDSKSLYKYANDLEETVRALGVKTEDRKKTEEPPITYSPPLPMP